MSKIFDALRKAEQEPNPLLLAETPVLVQKDRHPRDQRTQEREFGSLSSAVQSAFPRQTEGKVIVVAGCAEREGTTYVASHLAQILALQTGEPVLCVDGNFHDPGLTRMFQVKDGLGMADIYDKGKPRDVATMLRNGDQHNLYLLGTGRRRIVPGAFFDSPEFDALLASFRRTFRFTVFDSAPLIKHPDALHLAARTDGVIFVVRAGNLKREVIRKGIEMVESVNAPVLGAVLNRRRFAIPSLVYKLIS
jgi:Mrp family chromosome partitioning ATPase